MNKISKIFLVIIVILAVALGIMTYLYFNMRETAKNNLNMFLDEAEQLSESNAELNKYKENSNSSISVMTNTTSSNTTASYNPLGENIVGGNDVETPADNIEFNRNKENVTIEVLKNTITKESVEIIITDNNEDHYGWGVEFGVQEKVNGEWKELQYISDNLAWISIAYTPDENNQIKQKLDIEEYYGALSSGTYRIVKPIYDNGYIDLYSDEFDIK